MSPVAAPSTQNWTAATIDAPAAWRYPLETAGVAACRRIVQSLRDRPRDALQVRAEEFDLAPLVPTIAAVSAAIEGGRGFAVIDGLPLVDMSRDEANAVYWVVGQLLGEPLTQNVQGTLLYDVRDTGQDLSAGARFSVTNYESSFHTDNSFGHEVLDYVGLLCLQTAKSGGLSQVLSCYAACDLLQREDPAALAVLRQPFHVDRRGGVLPGESPTAHIPVIERRGDELLVRYLRYWIEEGHKKIGLPLATEQTAALDALDRVLKRPELRAEFMLEPGQMFFINNRWILHNRTAFEDFPDLDRRRHYVRLWLQARAAPRAA